MTSRVLTLSLMLLPLALAGCHKHGAGENVAHADTSSAGAQVPCALHGSAGFEPSCTVERLASGDGLILIVHHPDGGFRRLLVTTDGRGVVAADGSEPAMVSVIDPGTIEVAMGDDRYRLPATVKGQALPQR